MNQRKTYPIHQYAKRFPALDDDELEELAHDIRERGLLNPIWLDEQGMILDGRNRMAACQIAGVEPKFNTFHGDDEAKLHFVLSQNLTRRHLNTSQRAMLATEFRDEFAAMAAKRMLAGDPSVNLRKGRASEEVGELFNVSASAVDQARKVKEQAAPEIVEAVQRGDLAVSRASRLADLPKEEQVAALEAAPTRTKKPEIPDLWFCLVNGDPLSASDIYVNRYDADEPVTGDLVFASEQDAIDEGQKHYDMEDLKAVTVSDFLKESAGL